MPILCIVNEHTDYVYGIFFFAMHATFMSWKYWCDSAKCVDFHASTMHTLIPDMNVVHIDTLILFSFS